MISGNADERRVCSTTRPSASDSASDVPGSVTALNVSEPSLNSGRKARPKKDVATSATASNATAGSVTNHGWRSAPFSSGV